MEFTQEQFQNPNDQVSTLGATATSNCTGRSFSREHFFSDAPTTSCSNAPSELADRPHFLLRDDSNDDPHVRVLQFS